MSSNVKKRTMGQMNKRPRFSKMLTPTQIEQIQALHHKGMSNRKIARNVSVARNTVAKYLSETKCVHRKRESSLEKYRNLIRELFFSCGGNCEVVLRKLCEEHHLTVCSRTLREFCHPFRKELTSDKESFRRYETAPGQQMQIDFGQEIVNIAGRSRQIHFFVGVLGYSRRIFAKAYLAENQQSWLDGIESAFHYFGGAAQSILSDNSRCLVTEHKLGHSIQFTQRYANFCDYWQSDP